MKLQYADKTGDVMKTIVKKASHKRIAKAFIALACLRIPPI